ncbi:peptidoglycan lytic exotransglycosylase [Candidatus Electrothrix aarhusensis]|jgi:membrane-bound lytic murein transglycosylase A
MKTRSAVLLSLLILLVQGCDFSSPKSALVPLNPEQVQKYLWQDDQEFMSLKQAVKQSLGYYQGLPAQHTFNYAGITYTAREMEASTQLFLSIIAKYDGEQSVAEIQREIQRNFLFFESRNADGAAFFTGYYEPLLQGSLKSTKEFPTPLYGIPDDLITVNLKLFSEDFKGKKIIGRLKENRLVPYDSREDIMYRSSLQDRVAPLVYVQNDIELFFLQIQGSGIVQLRDNTFKRVNYSAQNGHSYRAIGALLKDEIPPKEMSLQSLKKYLYAHPEKVREVLTYNPSYTFFREVEEGPLGNIEVPLTQGRSLAMDHNLIPRGGLAFIETSYPPMNDAEQRKPRPLKRFAVVQDTGGAIRGHGRADIFWGHGEEAELVAGHMKEQGRIFLLVAKKEVLGASL